MRLIAPYPRHPLLWALADLCGMSLNEIAHLARMSRSVLDRADSGHALSDDQRRRLHDLLVWARDQLPTLVPPSDESPPPVRAYRRALFRVVAQVLADFPQSAASVDRETQLERDLVAAISTGRPVSDVLASLRRAYRVSSIRRCARRIDVQEAIRDGVHWWLHPLRLAPPPSVTPQFHPPTPQPRQPKTPHARQIADQISVVLGRSPGGSVSGPKVVAQVQARLPETSRSTIYRIARTMRIVRSVEGFGSSKRSTWSLPPSPTLSTPDEASPPLDVYAALDADDDDD